MSRITRITAFAATGVLLIVLAACGKNTSSSSTTTSVASPGDQAVTIHTFAFNPNPVTVKVGTKVTWTNQDDIHHTVTSGFRGHADGKFKGDLDGKGTKFSYVFTQAGVYKYHCEIHPGMDAEIDVN